MLTYTILYKILVVLSVFGYILMIYTKKKTANDFNFAVSLIVFNTGIFLLLRYLFADYFHQLDQIYNTEIFDEWKEYTELKDYHNHLLRSCSIIAIVFNIASCFYLFFMRFKMNTAQYIIRIILILLSFIFGFVGLIMTLIGQPGIIG